MDAGDAALVEKLKAMKEWSRAVIFNEEGHVIAGTFNANEAEVKYATQYCVVVELTYADYC